MIFEKTIYFEAYKKAYKITMIFEARENALINGLRFTEEEVTGDVN
jgi:hypothetical protein